MNIFKTLLEDLFKHGLTVLATYLVLRWGIPQEHAASLVNLAPLLSGIAIGLIGLGISVLHTSYLKWCAKVGPVGPPIIVEGSSLPPVKPSPAPSITPGITLITLGFIFLGFALGGCGTLTAGTGSSGTAATYLADLGKFTLTTEENPKFQASAQSGLTFAGKVILSKTVSGADRVAACNQMYAAGDMFDSLATGTPVTAAQMVGVAESWGINLNDGSDYSDAVNFVWSGISMIPGITASDIKTWLGILAASARDAASAYATNA